MAADTIKSDGEPVTQIRVNTSMPTEKHLEGYAAMSFLYFHTPSLAKLSVRQMALRIMPPLALGSFHIFYEDHMPRAAVTWALLGDETVEKIGNGVQLAPSEWVSGNQLWVMESLSPFKGNGGEVIARWVADVLAQNVDEFHFLRPSGNGQFDRHVTMTRAAKGWKTAVKRVRRTEEG